MTRVLIGLTIICCILCTPGIAASQPGALEAELDMAKALYREGRLEDAIGALRVMVVKLNELRDVRDRTLYLADAHLHLGLAYLGMRNESAAVESFRQMAALDPDRVLDPDIYSPRVLSVFARARADVGKALANGGPGPTSESRPRPTERTDLAPLIPAPMLLRILPGTKLRVESAGRPSATVGQLLAIDEKVLTIGAADWRLDLPRDRLTRVHMVVGRKNHWLAGMMIGGGLGVLTGALEVPGCGGNDGDCYTRGENMGYTGAGLGLIGALVGALYRTDQWVEVTVGGSASLTPSSPRLAVRVAWRY
ncbi:MAG TPA: tetratricopeptide repeat protein [Vicinamibacterales bacterium]|nr:tetratricopeptide repeat protein [Vicinamibacterales bacterium]